MPYYLSRANQDQSVVKAGFCVKQGAVVSVCTVGQDSRQGKVPQILTVGSHAWNRRAPLHVHIMFL